MPRSNSGTRKVARSLTTVMSLHSAICSPPPWHNPLTADTTGLTDCRSVSNGVTSMPSADPNVSQLSEPSPPPMSPPGANTSPVPVMSRPARSGSASTRLTAYLMPKYIAGVIALRAAGRSSVHTPKAPSRVNRRNGVPSQSPSGGRGVFAPAVVMRLLICRGCLKHVVDGLGVRCAVACARDQRGQRTRGARASQRHVRAGKPFRGKHSREHVARTGGIDRLHRRRGHVDADAGVDVPGARWAPGGHQMRYRPTPFAGFVVVGDDDVGDPG